MFATDVLFHKWTGASCDLLSRFCHVRVLHRMIANPRYMLALVSETKRVHSNASGLPSSADRTCLLTTCMWMCREKKRQELLDMGARAEALEQERARLRMLLSQRNQETLRLRQELIRVRGHASLPLQTPPQGGGLLPDLRGGAIAPGLPAIMASNPGGAPISFKISTTLLVTLLSLCLSQDSFQ